MEKSVAASTRGTRKLEDALHEAAAWPLAEAVFAENHAVGAMARQEADGKAKAETMRRLEAEVAKECADAEEKTRKVQEEAVRAKETADAEAKKAAAEAWKAGAKAKREAESTCKRSRSISMSAIERTVLDCLPQTDKVTRTDKHLTYGSFSLFYRVVHKYQDKYIVGSTTANYTNASTSSFLADRRRCRLFSSSLRRSTVSSGSLRSLLQRSYPPGPLIESPLKSAFSRSCVNPRTKALSMVIGTLSTKRLYATKTRH